MSVSDMAFTHTLLLFPATCEHVISIIRLISVSMGKV